MPKASDFLLQGDKKQVWDRYCGYLDLSLDEFMQIQERLLWEQLDGIKHSALGQRLLGKLPPKTLLEFRTQIPLTTYQDYAADFDARNASVLATEPFLWAHTSGRSGEKKWFPYSHQSFRKLGEQVLAGVILAAARHRGDVRLEKWDSLLSNTPPRPYISGVVLRALAEEFDFHFIPDLDVTEGLDFQERITQGFKTAMKTGIDILGSISVVLVKMGESFEQGANTGSGFSLDMVHPRVIVRYLRAIVRSRIEKRAILPKDLWQVKAIVTGGMDVSIYKDRITHYWGVPPFEQYGSTEVGVLAAHSWTKESMVFLPDAAFLEFLPLEQVEKLDRSTGFIPETALLHEVRTGEIYELVATSFHGNSLLRYRTNDLVEFRALSDRQNGIHLPQMDFVSRLAGVIDLSGFSGIMDEKMVWRALIKSGIDYEEWVIRKEVLNGKAKLHLYIEILGESAGEPARALVNDALQAINPYYADYIHMIDPDPLHLTLLKPGTFRGYMLEKVEAGADLAHIKPPHMNPSENVVQTLLRISGGIT